MNVQIWHDNFTVAIERSDQKNRKVYSDIRKFFLDNEAYVTAKCKMTTVEHKVTSTITEA